jgi:hypothetical protein
MKFKSVLSVILSLLFLSQSSLQAEDLKTNLKMTVFRVNKKKSRVFDRIKIGKNTFDSTLADLAIANSDGGVKLNFMGINTENELSALISESRGSKVDLTDNVTKIVLTENNPEDDQILVFEFPVKKVSAKRNKKGVVVQFASDTTAFSCVDYDFNCSDQVSLRLRGRIRLR